MKVEVAVLGSGLQIVLMVSADVKQHGTGQTQELCESRDGRPGLLVPNSPYGLCGHKAALKLIMTVLCTWRSYRWNKGRRPVSVNEW